MKTEADFMAESDAHTLATAKEIQKDPSRKAAATLAAKRLVSEEQTRLANLRSVANSATNQGGKPKRRIARGKVGRPGTKS